MAERWGVFLADHGDRAELFTDGERVDRDVRGVLPVAQVLDQGLFAATRGMEAGPDSDERHPPSSLWGARISVSLMSFKSPAICRDTYGQDTTVNHAPQIAKEEASMPTTKPNILILWGDDIGWWNISYNKPRADGLPHRHSRRDT
jgi:hypothetical protein